MHSKVESHYSQVDSRGIRYLDVVYRPLRYVSSRYKKGAQLSFQRRYYRGMYGVESERGPEDGAEI